MVIKAHSPAGFAEQYIVESIWNGGFPPGTILPAERELSELIGVTRTTLREVLQRLARDGWLTIKHGKPTKVNNFWETSSLNILETLAQLDQEGIPDLVDNLMSARTNISAIYVRGAIKNNPEKTIELLSAIEDVFKSKFRGRDVVDARSIYYYLSKVYTQKSYYYIAEKVNKDHASAIHGFNQLVDLVDFGDKELKTKLNDIKKVYNTYLKEVK